MKGSPGFQTAAGMGRAVPSCCGPQMDFSISLLPLSLPTPSPNTASCGDGLLQQMLCSVAATPHPSPVKNLASCHWDTSITMWQGAREVWTEDDKTGGM